MLPVGTGLTCRHFMPGQYLDICGTSTGKGFQGVMKRYGFGGQGASHGVSRAHRNAGSIGGCQDPGKVRKGQKMAGRMGNKRVTVQGLQLYKIDLERNLLFVKGAVPGHKGTWVRVTDSIKHLNADSMLQYPTADIEATDNYREPTALEEQLKLQIDGTERIMFAGDSNPYA